MNEDQNLRARVAQLEDRLTQVEDVHSVEDESGKEWSASDLMQLGLTRRQALAAIGTLAIYGGSIWGAIQYATRDARAATDQVGTQSQPVDVYADSLSADALGHSLEDNTDVTNSRALDTEYQNTNDHSLFVTVAVEYEDTEQSNIVLAVANSSGLGSEDRIDLKRFDGGANGYERATCQGIVPPGGYYALLTYGDDAGDLFVWYERGYQ